MTAPLRIASQRDGFRVTIVCAGEIDQSTADDLTHALGDALTGEPGELVLDLTGVGFIDSTALRSVILGATSAEAVGTRFTVLPSPPVERLLEMAGVRDIVQGRVHP